MSVAELTKPSAATVSHFSAEAKIENKTSPTLRGVQKRPRGLPNADEARKYSRQAMAWSQKAMAGSQQAMGRSKEALAGGEQAMARSKEAMAGSEEALAASEQAMA